MQKSRISKNILDTLRFKQTDIETVNAMLESVKVRRLV